MLVSYPTLDTGARCFNSNLVLLYYSLSNPPYLKLQKINLLDGSKQDNRRMGLITNPVGFSKLLA